MTFKCVKCTSEDVNVDYIPVDQPIDALDICVSQRVASTFEERCLNLDPFIWFNFDWEYSAKKEHLFCTCRSCGYFWRQNTFDDNGKQE